MEQILEQQTHNSSSITSRARGHEPAFKLPRSPWGATNLDLYKAVDIDPIGVPQIQQRRKTYETRGLKPAKLYSN